MRLPHRGDLGPVLRSRNPIWRDHATEGGSSASMVRSDGGSEAGQAGQGDRVGLLGQVRPCGVISGRISCSRDHCNTAARAERNDSASLTCSKDTTSSPPRSASGAGHPGHLGETPGAELAGVQLGGQQRRRLRPGAAAEATTRASGRRRGRERRQRAPRRRRWIRPVGGRAAAPGRVGPRARRGRSDREAVPRAGAGNGRGRPRCTWKRPGTHPPRKGTGSWRPPEGRPPEK